MIAALKKAVSKSLLVEREKWPHNSDKFAPSALKNHGHG